MKREDSLPLKSYVFPIKDNNGILEHSPFIVNLLDNDLKVLEVDGLGNIVLEERKEKPEKKTKRKSQKKK